MRRGEAFIPIRHHVNWCYLAEHKVAKQEAKRLNTVDFTCMTFLFWRNSFYVKTKNFL